MNGWTHLKHGASTSQGVPQLYYDVVQSGRIPCYKINEVNGVDSHVPECIAAPLVLYFLLFYMMKIIYYKYLRPKVTYLEIISTLTVILTTLIHSFNFVHLITHIKRRTTYSLYLCVINLLNRYKFLNVLLPHIVLPTKYNKPNVKLLISSSIFINLIITITPLGKLLLIFCIEL